MKHATPEATSQLELARTQRDQAYACAFFAVVIAAVVVLTNFRPNPVPMREMDGLLREHRESFKQHWQIVLANAEVLNREREELEKLRRSP